MVKRKISGATADNQFLVKEYCIYKNKICFSSDSSPRDFAIKSYFNDIPVKMFPGDILTHFRPMFHFYIPWKSQRLER